MIEDIISGDLYRDEKPEIEIVCEPCSKIGMETEATHESWNVEMCYDCWSEFNE
tara:strand:+ start:314 stop:475 length:162 start_codon:yes stop_codon:yes gene_type:complete